VQVWATGSGGATFLGAAALGLARSDIGNVFGAQFANAGFSLNASLPAGSYRITVFVHDVNTGTFNLSDSRNITVAGSAVALSIDVPGNGGTAAFGSGIIAGWAIDRVATGSAGIDAVHVWATPVGVPGQTTFVGAATIGLVRNDIGNAFGSNFVNSGYILSLQGLARGTYDLAVLAHSAMDGSWTPKVVRVTIQ